MLRLFGVFGRNRVTTLGALLVFASFIVFVALFLMDVSGQIRNPYVSIITYFMVPTVLLLGLVLVPFGALTHARYVRKKGEVAKPYFTFDFNDPPTRRRGWFFAFWTALFTFAFMASAYRGNGYMEKAEFCGKTCHVVMQPEYTAYLRSSHARVPCVECHIGPGLPWLFRQKLTGLRQTWHSVTNSYEAPIMSPVKDLRPAREVCEICHWPQRFYGEVTRYIYTYDADENNTPEVTVLTMHVGQHLAESTGIHSHIEKHIWYRAADAKRMKMAWVYEQRTDGKVNVWVPEGTTTSDASPTAAGGRRMDCVDCHNRSAHRFDSFERLVDDAITTGELPRVPWIKKVATDIAPPIEGPITFAQQRDACNRLASIPESYKQTYPGIYRVHEKEIRSAARTLSQLYRDCAFPAMKVYPEMITDLKSHEGCDRCHGALVAISGPMKGKKLPGRDEMCGMCHKEPQMLSGEAAAKL